MSNKCVQMWFLAALALAIGCITTCKAFVPASRHHPASTRRHAKPEDESSSSPLPFEPSKKQQEQLEKYGSTPETSIELLFDQLMAGGDGGEDGEDDGKSEFWQNQPEGAGEKWKDFLDNMKQVKQQQQQQDDDDDEEE